MFVDISDAEEILVVAYAVLGHYDGKVRDGCKIPGALDQALGTYGVPEIAHREALRSGTLLVTRDHSAVLVVHGDEIGVASFGHAQLFHGPCGNACQYRLGEGQVSEAVEPAGGAALVAAFGILRLMIYRRYGATHLHGRVSQLIRRGMYQAVGRHMASCHVREHFAVELVGLFSGREEISVDGIGIGLVHGDEILHQVTEALHRLFHVVQEDIDASVVLESSEFHEPQGIREAVQRQHGNDAL